MRRSFVAAFLGFVLLGVMFGWAGVFAQGGVSCLQTPAVGTSNTQCANTAFVTNTMNYILSIVPTLTGDNIWTGDNFFGSGRPWCDPRAYGALGDDAHADSDAFYLCLAALRTTGGGEFRVSSGHYCLPGRTGAPADSGLTLLSGDNIAIVGSNYDVNLDTCGSNITLVTLAGNGSSIERMTLVAYGMQPSDVIFSSGSLVPSHPSLFINGCQNECWVRDMTVLGGTGIYDDGGVEVHFLHVFNSYSYGSSLFLLQGGGLWTDRLQLDQTAGCPNLGYGAVGSGSWPPTAWASGQSYAPGQVLLFSASGFIAQVCSVGASGGVSGGIEPAPKPYNQDITDNPGVHQVIWRIEGPYPYYGMVMDSGTIQPFLRGMDIDGPFATALITDNSVGAAFFLGTIAGTTLTVNTTPTGNSIAVGQSVYGYGVAAGTKIVSGSALSWQVNNSQTVGPVSMSTTTSSPPQLITISDSNFGATFSHIFDIGYGDEFYLTNSTIGNCLSTDCVGIFIHGAYGGGGRIENDTIYGGGYGIDLSSPSAGTAGLIIAGNRFSGWAVDALFATNVYHFNFEDNQCLASAYATTNGQCYDASGALDYYLITNSDTTGSTSPSSPANGAGSAHSTVSGNQ